MALFIRLPRRRIRDEHVHLSLPDRFTKRLHEPSRYGQSNQQIGETGSFVPPSGGRDHVCDETIWIVRDALTGVVVFFEVI